MRATRSNSMRAQLLGIVFLGAILPLALIGFWLTGNNVRAGETLLSDQLDSSLHKVASVISRHWENRGSDLTLLTGNMNARVALSNGVVAARDSQFFGTLASQVRQDFRSFAYRDRTGTAIFAFEEAVGGELVGQRMATAGVSAALGRAAGGDAGAPRTTLKLSYPVILENDTVGRLDAEMYLDAVLPADSAALLPAGSSLALRNRRSGEVLRTLGGGRPFPESRIISVDSAKWMARTYLVDDPPLELAAAAPMAPYVRPFIGTGVLGIMALLVVAAIAVALTTALTARLARSVDILVESADVVAGGDLSRRAAPSGPTELRKIAHSFNAMTRSLELTMQELSQRRALAAVGEFAAALSHQVRNALTSVQIDMELIDEQSENAKNRAILSRALANVRRLDAAVTGSLRIARSGHIVQEDVRLGQLLRETAVVAEPSFVACGLRLKCAGFDEGPLVRGDDDALQHLFLNLLMNAQQALQPGGAATISILPSGQRVVVSISDTGRGMLPEELEKAVDAFYTTRPLGTGLGLPIARQIAIAHGGELRIRSSAGVGTTVEVTLPVRVDIAEV